MERRKFLLLLAAGLTGAATVRGTGELISRPAVAAAGRPPSLEHPAGSRVAQPVAALSPAAVRGQLLAPTGVVDHLPGAGSSLALTVDDGTSSEVVAAYLAFAVRTGVRLTFFPNGCYRSWQENKAVLRRLVDSGQVALGNHTWSHPDVTKLSDRDVADQIRRNKDFLRDTFGVRDTPFFRPPYGAHDARTDGIAADLGHPTIALWYGTLGDDKVISAEELLAAGQRWFTAQRIVIGHANHPAVTTIFDQLHQLISDRQLTTVTLADVWTPRSRLVRGASVQAAAPVH